MKVQVYRAAVNGDVSILEDASGERLNELQSLTLESNNIIHIAAKHGHEKFILAVVKRLAKANELVEQRNNNGDTPLHVAARHGQQAAAELVATNGPASLGIVQNKDGDTPLHVALKYCRLRLASALSSRSPQAFSVLNRTKETPFHLLIKGGLLQPTTLADQNWMLSSQAVAYQIKFEDSFARHLLSSFKDAACLRDEEGLTPLLRAAHCGLFRVLNIILEICPESVEVYDPKGRTVLHYARFLDYMQLQLLLKAPEIDALKDVKDCQGNTPAHLAVKTRDLTLLTGLYDSMADFALKNNEDVSVEHLVDHPHGGFSSKMEKLKFNIAMGKTMEKELYVASTVSGDVTIFEKKDTTTIIDGKEIRYNDEYFMSRTANGSTILHLAIQNGHLDFVKETLKHFPTLILSRDFNGDNVLHEAARLKAPGAELMVCTFVECMRTFEGMKQPDGVIYHSPWKGKNSKGNNTLHEAMRTSNHKIIVELLNIDPSLSLDINNAHETPLHVFAKYATYTVEDALGVIITLILESNATCAYQMDADGLTPLMRAAKSDRIRIADLITQICPESIEVRDSKGRTFLHLLNIVHLELVDAAEDRTTLGQFIFFTPGVDKLRIAQDEDGNTPLHLALITKNFVTAKVLLLRCLRTKTREELYIINEDGHSIFSLLSMLQAHKSDDKEYKEMVLISMKLHEKPFVIEEMMDKELYKAAVEGDVNVFKEFNDEEGSGGGGKDRSYFLAQTPDRSTIVHTTLKMGKGNTEAFVEEALKLFPSLICRRDSNGDTPLHLAVRWSDLKGSNPASVKLLELAMDSYAKALEESSRKMTTGVVLPLWIIRNSQGNMPIHEALSFSNFIAASFLIDNDPEASSHVNDAGETALHVVARCTLSKDVELRFMEKLIMKNVAAAYIRDNEGLTPVLRSAKCGRVLVGKAILKYCPLSAQLYDPNGRNVLHLLHLDADVGEEAFDIAYERLGQKLFEVPEVDALRIERDSDGNTPLQYALKTGNFITAKVLAQKCVKDEVVRECLTLNNDSKRQCGWWI